MEKEIWNHIQTVRSQSPLVHNITNYVVMNITANVLLASGASPIMAHAQSEVEDMVKIVHASVINIGTLDEYWAESMLLASKAAQQSGKPWVLDPVGAGATPYRDKVLQSLLVNKPTVIRGNASEIIALAKKNTGVTKGADSTAKGIEALAAAQYLVKSTGSVVCISGGTDYVISNSQTILIKNGSPLMTKITGMGCSASALVGAFVGVVKDTVQAVTAAMVLIGIAGELSAKQSSAPGTMQGLLLDKLYNLSEKEFLDNVKVSQ